MSAIPPIFVSNMQPNISNSVWLTTIDLQTIHTDPRHQRRGAGLLLVKRCKQDGDAMGLSVWLESSDDGHRLYERCGFEDVEELVTDLSTWGAHHPHRSWLMVKHARPASLDTANK